MRKALIAVAVATALFAVGAFAANLTVQSEDVASGSDPVTACAEAVDIDFNTPVLAGAIWTTDGATVRFVDADGDPVGTCDNFTAQLAVNSGAGYVQYGTTVAVNASEASFTFSPAIDINPIIGATVAVDGATLTAQLP